MTWWVGAPPFQSSSVEGEEGDWIPAYAGMTEGVAGMTGVARGMTGDARPFDRLQGERPFDMLKIRGMNGCGDSGLFAGAGAEFREVYDG